MASLTRDAAPQLQQQPSPEPLPEGQAKAKCKAPPAAWAKVAGSVPPLGRSVDGADGAGSVLDAGAGLDAAHQIPAASHHGDRAAHVETFQCETASVAQMSVSGKEKLKSQEERLAELETKVNKVSCDLRVLVDEVKQLHNSVQSLVRAQLFSYNQVFSVADNRRFVPAELQERGHPACSQRYRSPPRGDRVSV